MRRPYMHVHRDDLRPVFIEVQNTVAWIGELIDEGIPVSYDTMNELWEWVNDTMASLEVLLRE